MDIAYKPPNIRSEKFLIGRDGKVVGRWASTSKPESLASAIERELKKAAPGSEL